MSINPRFGIKINSFPQTRNLTKLSQMTGLQKIALGWMIVMLPAFYPRDPNPSWKIYDLLADPIGWALICWGISNLPNQISRTIIKPAAAIGTLISLPLWFPQINHTLSTAMLWYTTLPGLIFAIGLANELAKLAKPSKPSIAANFKIAQVCYFLICLGSLLVFSKVAPELVTSLGLLLLGSNAFFCYLLLRHHQAIWLPKK